MLFITIKIVLLLGSIVIPLGAKKASSKSTLQLRIDTDTRHAQYAVNADGMLEKIHRASIYDINEAD